MSTRRRARRGFTILEALTVIGIVVALLSLGWPNWWQSPDALRGRESIAELHEIQSALQRYAADHGGTYPDFLYGGDFLDDFTTHSSPRQSTFPEDLDVLLEEGYLASYPQNPFVSRPFGGRLPTKQRVFVPRDWNLPRDPGRVGWYAEGGDRALHLTARRVGGDWGTAMLDMTEGQRHAPPIWTVKLRTPANAIKRIATPWRHVSAGNFVYHAHYTGNGGYRWSPELARTDTRLSPLPPKAMGYALWVYGPSRREGLDLHTERGIPLEPWLEPGPLWRDHGPDSAPDGVLSVLTHPPSIGDLY